MLHPKCPSYHTHTDTHTQSYIQPHGRKRGLQREAERGAWRPTTVTEPSSQLRGAAERKGEEKPVKSKKTSASIIDATESRGGGVRFLLQSRGRYEERRERRD